MSEEGEEGSIITEDMSKPLVESEIGPTSLDVTDDRVSIGPTSIDVTDEQASLQKQKRTTPTVDTGIGKLQFQSTKQIQSQISHLQKQVTQIQKDIQRLITVPTKRTNTRLRKLSSTTGSKPKSKKGKPLKATKARKGSNRSRL